MFIIFARICKKLFSAITIIVVKLTTLSNTKHFKYEDIVVSTPLCHYIHFVQVAHTKSDQSPHTYIRTLPFFPSLYVCLYMFAPLSFGWTITAPHHQNHHSVDHLHLSETTQQPLRHLASYKQEKKTGNTSEVMAISRRICPKLTSVNHYIRDVAHIISLSSLINGDLRCEVLYALHICYRWCGYVDTNETTIA